jgi:hypothetical protein
MISTKTLVIDGLAAKTRDGQAFVIDFPVPRSE